MTGQRVLPGLGLSAYWTKGTGNWDVQHDPDTRKLSALVQCHVKSRTALPGSPVDGDIYLVPSNAGTNPNQIVIRDNGAWVYFAPQEGWLVWVDDEDVFVVWSGAAWNPFRPGTVLPDIAGKAGKVLKVNAGATGLAWADDLQGSGGGGDPTDPVDDPKFSPHAYWRFVAIAGSTGNPFIRMSNIEFRAGGVDLTGSNGVAFADVGNAANAFDSSDSTYWDSGGLGSGPHYVGWQFDDATAINSFAIRPVDSEGNNLTAFRIDFSDDGVDYTTAFEYEGAGLPNNNVFAAGWYQSKVPAGGTAGQVLAKASPEDFDTHWINLPNPNGGGSRGAHAYWRILPTANTGDNGYIHLAEIVFAAEPGGVQLATGGTPIGSGHYANQVPANAYDGVPSTVWESQSGSVSGGTVWIGYNFAEPVEVHQVRLTNLLSYENDEWITAGKVQFSDNGTAWSDAWSFVLAPWVGSSGNQTQNTTDPSLFKLRTFTGATDTAQLTDANKVIVGNAGTAQTATIPANATAAFEIGDVLTWMQRGAGKLSIAGAGGVTLDVPDSFTTAMRHRYGSISATKVDTNEWIITGALSDA